MLRASGYFCCVRHIALLGGERGERADDCAPVDAATRAKKGPWGLREADYITRQKNREDRSRIINICTNLFDIFSLYVCQWGVRVTFLFFKDIRGKKSF
jgi:hypothetical protein